jgi:hypothetical protein
MQGGELAEGAEVFLNFGGRASDDTAAKLDGANRTAKDLNSLPTPGDKITVLHEETLSVVNRAGGLRGHSQHVSDLLERNIPPLGDVYLGFRRVEMKANLFHCFTKGVLSSQNPAKGSREDHVVSVRREEDVVLQTNLCQNGVDGQREESAAQRVALLDPRFTVNVGNLSIVKVLETALATVMSLNVIP